MVDPKIPRVPLGSMAADWSTHGAPAPDTVRLPWHGAISARSTLATAVGLWGFSHRTLGLMVGYPSCRGMFLYWRHLHSSNLVTRYNKDILYGNNVCAMVNLIIIGLNKYYCMGWDPSPSMGNLLKIWPWHIMEGAALQTMAPFLFL